jgi:3D-(3,5/4)-trihydroxycyclohexane-1,2-dione acylhydrolase (decyclizing)
VAGGGVIYSGAEATLLEFSPAHNIPLVETQAGKGAVDWDHRCTSARPASPAPAAATNWRPRPIW